MRGRRFLATRLPRTGSAAALACVSLSAACPAAPPPREVVAVEVSTCVPGASTPCACPGDAFGVQLCLPDGQTLGACAQCTPVTRDEPMLSATASAMPAPTASPTAFTAAPFATGMASSIPPWGRTASTPYISSTSQAIGAPLPPQACHTFANCQWRGECTATSLGCALTSDADCKQSDPCRLHGRCTFAAAKSQHASPTCEAASRADCMASIGCQKLGACSAANGRCQAATSANCLGSEVCTEHGLCSADQGSCAAKRVADCQGSVACKQHGYCTPRGGLCVR